MEVLKILDHKKIIKKIWILLFWMTVSTAILPVCGCFAAGIGAGQFPGLFGAAAEEDRLKVRNGLKDFWERSNPGAVRPAFPQNSVTFAEAGRLPASQSGYIRCADPLADWQRTPVRLSVRMNR